MSKLSHLPVRSIDIGELQDSFLVCAVATILIIRTQLWLTNYPQLGGHGLHIAHLLWGGLLMMIAIGLALSFLGHSTRQLAAIVGGVGFGFFIDELGKFVTSDNNYFFKPTAALIYVLFVVLFLITRNLQTRRGFSQREYLVNAVDLLLEAARHDLDESERGQALAMLQKADQSEPLVAPLRDLLSNSEVAPSKTPPRIERLARAARDRYFEVVDRRWFQRLVGWVFAVWAAATLVRVGTLFFGDDHLSFINICSAVSSGVAAAFVVWGVVRLRGGERLGAYRMFDRALLVQIFITQAFEFVQSQFSAVFGLGVAVVLLATIRYMMRRELQHERERA